MQPPLRISGNSAVDWVALCTVSLFWLRSLLAARGGAGLFVKSLTIGSLAFVLYQFVVSRADFQPDHYWILSFLWGNRTNR